MSKKAVYTPHWPHSYWSDSYLKKLCIFFDEIYIGNHKSVAKLKPSNKVDLESLPHVLKMENELRFGEYLIHLGVVKEYDKVPLLNNQSIDPAERQHVTKYLEKLKSEASSNFKSDNPEIVKARLNEIFEINDIHCRVDAMELSRLNNDSEFYPVLHTNKTFIQIGTKQKVVKFVLGKLPEPDSSTSWDHILEFRTDQDVRNKYLALINWINKVAASGVTFSDIMEEFEYLYSDYMKHFKLHKMKYNNTMIEVIVIAGAGLLMALQSGQFIAPFKNLIQLNLSHINLLQEEAKLPGKQLAYIYTAKENFDQ